MKLKTIDGSVVEIDSDVIVAAAGRIYAARRKRFGGAPRKLRPCRWCRAEIAGEKSLQEHERGCDARREGLEQMTPEELAQWAL
jgi:hypothetical protein